MYVPTTVPVQFSTLPCEQMVNHFFYTFRDDIGMAWPFGCIARYLRYKKLYLLIVLGFFLSTTILNNVEDIPFDR